jgi:Bifunctional DNA primase/polymerase, N-terminal
VPATARGFYDASTNPATIRRLFGNGDRNMAVRTGPESGCWVFDVDNQESYVRLIAECGPLPLTRQSQSSRGVHYWFRMGLPVPCSTGRIAKGLDVKGTGGYVMAPPSVHEDGPTYRWLNDAPLIEAPPWLLRLTRKPEPPAAAIARIGHNRPPSTPGVYGGAARDNEIEALSRQTKPGRNHALNKASFRLHQLVAGGELDGGDVEQRLIEAATANGLVQEDGLRQVLKTIRSGARAGMKFPRSRKI